MLISIVVFGLVGQQPLWLELISRVVLIPVIAGAAYEVLRFTADHYDNRLVRILIQPNLELQYFTTREPNDEQLELAIVALRSVLVLDGVILDTPVDGLQPVPVPVVAE
jgi:uncharacterized protein YqhQ